MSDEGTGPETDSNILLLMFGQGDSDSLIWNILNRYMSLNILVIAVFDATR